MLQALVDPREVVFHDFDHVLVGVDGHSDAAFAVGEGNVIFAGLNRGATDSLGPGVNPSFGTARRGGSGENIARVTETDQDIGGFEISSQGSLASVPVAFRHPGRLATEEGEAQEKEEERAEGETTPRLFSL